MATLCNVSGHFMRLNSTGPGTNLEQLTHRHATSQSRVAAFSASLNRRLIIPDGHISVNLSLTGYHIVPSAIK